MNWTVESLSTCVAHEFLESTMYDFMISKCVFETESCITNVACVRFFAGVDSSMAGHLFLSTECLAALVTDERFFVGVSQIMRVTIASLQKTLLTHVTFVWFLREVDFGVPP